MGKIKIQLTGPIGSGKSKVLHGIIVPALKIALHKDKVALGSIDVNESEHYVMLTVPKGT